jgi:hypothetical protein
MSPTRGTRPWLLLGIWISLWTGAPGAGAVDDGPRVLSVGFELTSTNLCPEILVYERKQSSEYTERTPGYTWFGLYWGTSAHHSTSDVEREWEKVDCDLDPDSLREAVLAGLAVEGVLGVAAAKERELLALKWVKEGRIPGRDDARAAARQVGADLVFTGSLRDLGDNVQLSIQVIDAWQGDLIGATSESFRHVENLPSRVQAAVATALGQARTTRPLLWLTSATVRGAADRAASAVDETLHQPAPGVTETVMPSGRFAGVRLQGATGELLGPVLLEGTDVGTVVSREGAEVLVESSGRLAEGDRVSLPVAGWAVHWTVGPVDDDDPMARSVGVLADWVAEHTVSPLDRAIAAILSTQTSERGLELVVTFEDPHTHTLVRTTEPLLP